MFANRFDTLMNIARLSNSRLGQAVKLNSSYIGRLRNGARPLPKKHPYLPAMCRYLAEHMGTESQLDALYRLTGLQAGDQTGPEGLGPMLERWLLAGDEDTGAAAGRFISGFTRLSSAPMTVPASGGAEPGMKQYASFLFGNEGKRRAVEQFFLLILQEREPQTLLLFSEENMEWMYEDPAFAKRWAELFTKVLLRGNRVKIIHTVSRTMNEILEAVMKWVPIYMTGAIQPYYYPRIRDDLFQHTLFIAPRTAAIVSRSVRQDTAGMLNEFITDREAVAALTAEYERYFSLCLPLMEIFTQRDLDRLQPVLQGLDGASGDTYLRSALPPLFALPEKTVRAMDRPELVRTWQRSCEAFEQKIREEKLYLTVEAPETALLTPEKLVLTEGELLGTGPVRLTEEQYSQQLERLRELADRYPNLRVRQQSGLAFNNFLYVRESAGVMMAKTDAPAAAFVIREQNMRYAFSGYIRRDFENGAPLRLP